MTSGDQVWLGTGGGRVLVFSYALNVPNLGEAIEKLTRQKASATEATPTSDGGGLLSTDQKGTAETPEGDKWVEVSEESHTPVSTSPSSRYARRRKTQFGKTLRNRSHKGHQRVGVPDVYRLKYCVCGDMISGASDSVRVLLPYK